MITFKDFLNEMPVETGINLGTSFSKEDTYQSYIQTNVKFKTISEVANGKYVLLEYNETLYLIDEKTKEYLGSIQYHIKNKKLFIETSYSKIKGFYGMVFTHILKDMDVEYIFGDSQQSTQAKTSWKRLMQGFGGVVLDTTTNTITDYDENKESEYWGKDKLHIRIGITENKALLEKMFSVTLEKILKDKDDGVLKTMYYNKDPDLDNYFYPNKILNI